MRSNTSKSYKEELLSNLKDKEYRRAFVESHINNGIPFQIRAIRGKLTQNELGKLAGMKQTQICRFENPNYGKFTLSTLKEIAAAFDVALIVRFAPFSALVEWDLNLSPESLLAVNFDEDPYFKEQPVEETIDKYLNVMRERFLGEGASSLARTEQQALISKASAHNQPKIETSSSELWTKL